MEREKIKNLLIEQGYDCEIYSDDSLDHETALLEFLEEHGCSIELNHLLQDELIPFVDADGVAGVRTVITILPYQLDVHMVAFSRREWDYYINKVSDYNGRHDNKLRDYYQKHNIQPLNPQPVKTIVSIDVVLLQTELESGLKPQSIRRLVSLLDKEEEYIPFSTSENNSSAHGFIKATVLEEHFWNTDDIESFVRNIIGDIENESSDGFYEMRNGITLFIGYDDAQKLSAMF